MKIREFISFITIQTIMVCLLTFNPVVTQFGVAEAASPVFSPEAAASLERMSDLQGSLKGVGARDTFSLLAPRVAEKGQEFIASLKGKDRDILKTPKGARFLKDHSQLARIEGIKNGLQDCVKDKEGPSGLYNQILHEVENGEYNGGCDYRLTFERNGTIVNSSLDSFISNLRKTQKAMNGTRQNSYSDFQDAIHMQALKNSFSSYLAIRYRYEPNFIDSKGKINPIDLSRSLSDICTREGFTQKSRGASRDYSFCSQAQKDELSKFAKKKAIEIQATQKKSSYSEAVSNLQSSFSRLNESLNKIHVKVDYDGIDGADLSDSGTRTAWQTYNKNYLEEIQKQDGMLMLTSTVKEKAGGVKRLEADVENKGGWVFGKKYEITKHSDQGLDTATLRKAKEEIQRQTIAEAKQLNQMAHEKRVQEANWKNNKYAEDTWTGTDHGNVYDKRKEDVKKLIKLNPTAVGQVLLNNPNMTDIVCDAINDIDQEIKDKGKNDTIATWGAIFVGGVMVGGLIACTIITFGVCGAAAGVVIAGAGATALTLGTAATATLFVAGGLEAAYWANRTYEHHTEHRELEQAVLTGQMDPKYAGKVEEAFTNFKEARFNFLMALPAVVLPGIGKLASISKGSKFGEFVHGLPAATRVKFLDNMADIYKMLGKSEKMRKLMDVMIDSGKVSAEKMHQFLELLATPIKAVGGKAGEFKTSMNTKFLAWMEGKLSKMESAQDLDKFMGQFKKIIDEGLEAAERACKI